MFHLASPSYRTAPDPWGFLIPSHNLSVPSATEYPQFLLSCGHQVSCSQEWMEQNLVSTSSSRNMKGRTDEWYCKSDFVDRHNICSCLF